MIAREISSEYPQVCKKIKVIHNGFDPNRFQFANEATRAELKEESGNPRGDALVLLCKWLGTKRSQSCSKAYFPN